MTDQDLLRAYAESADTDSLGVFVGRYQNTLMRFAARFLHDVDAAQDVVQETFLVVARHPKKVLAVDSPHNWLLRVARNLGIDHLRRTARARKYALESAAPATAVAEERQEAATCAVEREEMRRRVREEVDKLTPRYRELILLKVQEEKSYQEIAEITGLTVTNVGYLLHHGMKALARRLQGHREELL